tara:strand:+ start:8734 stop:9261 length:528 start_codon:yes stop_codon:yes gene_type:complete
MEAGMSVRPRFRATLAFGLTTLCCSCSLPSPSPGVGDQAPDVEVLTLAGDTVALGSFQGEPVLLNLWATWCGPCREETPYLQNLHDTYSERGLRVVGVSQDRGDSGSAIKAFIEEFGVAYTVLADPEMIATDRYGVIGLPATFLVDRDGTIRQVVMGVVTPESPTFESALRSIIQ